MKKVILTKKQNDRRLEIGDKLWDMRFEENKLQKELKEIGLEYDLVGRPKFEVEVKKSEVR